MNFDRVALRDVATVVMGLSPKSDDVVKVKKGLPLLNGPTEFGAFSPTPRQWAEAWAREAWIGDILFCVRGSTTGRINVADQAYAIGRGIAAIRGATESDTRFIKYAFMEGLPQLLSLTSGSVFPNLSVGDIRGFNLSWPDEYERVNIAATLGALDDKIESNRRAIELIDELVRARFDCDFNVEQAVDGVAIGDLVSINRQHKLVHGEEATYVGMSSLPEFSPAILDWERRAFGTGQKFVSGDVLMARITPCLENGKTAVVDMLGEGEVGWGSTEYVVLSPLGAFSTPWIYALTRSQTIRDWAISRMTGTSGRQSFQATEFDQYRIQEPDYGTLAAFNDFAVPLFQKVTQARDEIKLLQQLRDVLLPELLSGRIRTTSRGDA